jgi:putative ABC transport system ATP-binding protein
MLEIKNVSKVFRIAGSTVNALTEITLSVAAGEFLAITGPSGSGKSTLLNIVGCIEKPTSGVVRIDGVDITRMSLDALAPLRALKLGYIFQTFNLLPVLTVAENIEFPLYLRKIPGARRRELALKAAREVGLETRLDHKPGELSGGQRQRVAIARAMAGSPALILADEPTANLDHATGSEILDLMSELNKKTKTTFIFSTHDPKVMSRAGRTAELSDGRLKAS